MLKKLGAIIALILCVTIGGVYASWTYVQTSDVADITKNKSVNLTDANFEGSNGAYTLDISTLVFQIDQDTTAEVDHTAVLKIMGDLVLTFTPGANADGDIKDGKYDTWLLIGLSANWKYNNTDVFTLTGTEFKLDWTNANHNEETNTYTITYTAAQLAEIIKLGSFVLDSKSDYDEFGKALSGKEISFTITDKKTSSTPATGE